MPPGPVEAAFRWRTVGLAFRRINGGIQRAARIWYPTFAALFDRSTHAFTIHSGQVWPPDVRCRHHTDLKGLKGIKNDRAIKASRGTPAGVDVEVEPFATARTLPARSSPAAQTGAAGGGAYVEFDVPEGTVVPTSPMVGPRKTARILADASLPLEGLNPRFVTVSWWKFWA
jgi:hypothetical protein